jgi:hypothetical protein
MGRNEAAASCNHDRSLVCLYVDIALLAKKFDLPDKSTLTISAQ